MNIIYVIVITNLYFSSLIDDEICRMAFVASIEAIPTHGERVKSPTGLLPLAGTTELPDCTVCLERMDESVRGILTILCNHSFHGACLQQWEDLWLVLFGNLSPLLIANEVILLFIENLYTKRYFKKFH